MCYESNIFQGMAFSNFSYPKSLRILALLLNLKIDRVMEVRNTISYC